MKFNDGQVDMWSDFYQQDIYSMLTDINNKSIDFWSERIFHQITHRIYQEIIIINNQYTTYELKQKDVLIEKLNNDLLNNKQILKIKKIMINLNIKYSDNDSLDKKLDKIIKY
ncbi:3440_t:CDS:1, partial [Scutellospora calospora]